jgi:hypothetical protein
MKENQKFSVSFIENIWEGIKSPFMLSHGCVCDLRAYIDLKDDR